MKAGLSFLAALAPAHLLQKWRDTNGLHPVFCGPDEQLAVLSPVFWNAHQTTSGDLRKFLTALRLLPVGIWLESLSSAISRLSSDEVAIGGILLLCSFEHTLLKKERTA